MTPTREQFKEFIAFVKKAQETDCVGITPGANKYVHNEKIGNEIRLPYVDDDITAEQIADIIAATEWEPQRKVTPINNKEQ